MLRGRTEELERLAVEMYARGLSVRDIEAAFTDETERCVLTKSAAAELTERLWADYQAFAGRDLAQPPNPTPPRCAASIVSDSSVGARQLGDCVTDCKRSYRIHSGAGAKTLNGRLLWVVSKIAFWTLPVRFHPNYTT